MSKMCIHYIKGKANRQKTYIIFVVDFVCIQENTHRFKAAMLLENAILIE